MTNYAERTDTQSSPLVAELALDLVKVACHGQQSQSGVSCKVCRLHQEAGNEASSWTGQQSKKQRGLFSLHGLKAQQQHTYKNITLEILQMQPFGWYCHVKTAKRTSTNFSSWQNSCSQICTYYLLTTYTLLSTSCFAEETSLCTLLLPTTTGTSFLPYNWYKLSLPSTIIKVLMTSSPSSTRWGSEMTTRANARVSVRWGKDVQQWSGVDIRQLYWAPALTGNAHYVFKHIKALRLMEVRDTHRGEWLSDLDHPTSDQPGKVHQSCNSNSLWHFERNRMTFYTNSYDWWLPPLA